MFHARRAARPRTSRSIAGASAGSSIDSRAGEGRRPFPSDLDGVEGVVDEGHDSHGDLDPAQFLECRPRRIRRWRAERAPEASPYAGHARAEFLAHPGTVVHRAESRGDPEPFDLTRRVAREGCDRAGWARPRGQEEQQSFQTRGDLGVTGRPSRHGVRPQRDSGNQSGAARPDGVGDGLDDRVDAARAVLDGLDGPPGLAERPAEGPRDEVARGAAAVGQDGDVRRCTTRSRHDVILPGRRSAATLGSWLNQSSPSVARPTVLRQRIRRWGAGVGEFEAAELLSESEELGATAITECCMGERVTVAGTLRTVTLRPVGGVPALEAGCTTGRPTCTSCGWVADASLASCPASRWWCTDD